MKNNKSAFFAVAVSAMLGMGTIEANAQQTRYEGTVTIHQKDGTKTSFNESDLWRIENREDYVYAVTKQIQPQKYTDVDHVSFDWIAQEVGKISLNYKREISADELKQAVKDMRTQLGSALNAVYSMRGGKDGARLKHTLISSLITSVPTATYSISAYLTQTSHTLTSHCVLHTTCVRAQSVVRM